MSKKSQPDIPVCCWNCAHSGDQYIPPAGWPCDRNQPSRRIKGTHSCPQFTYFGDI